MFARWRRPRWFNAIVSRVAVEVDAVGSTPEKYAFFSQIDRPPVREHELAKFDAISTSINSRKVGMLNPMRDKMKASCIWGGEGKTPVTAAWLVQKVAEGKISHELSGRAKN